MSGVIPWILSPLPDPVAELSTTGKLGCWWSNNILGEQFGILCTPEDSVQKAVGFVHRGPSDLLTKFDRDSEMAQSSGELQGKGQSVVIIPER